MTRTELELRNRLEANNFEPITIVMKCNGDDVCITPCSDVRDINSFDDIDWYLVDSPSLNLVGGTLANIADKLDHYAELIKESEEEVEQLKDHIRQYGEASDWSWVSDWHKDLFGHRPHVGHEQLIAWANSKNTDSARFYC